MTRCASPPRHPITVAARFVVRTVLVLTLFAAAATPVAAADGPNPAVSSSYDFTLSDTRGQDIALADFADRSAVVICFVGNECPLAKLYTPRLVELAARYADRDVAFLAVNSNRQDSLAEMAEFARQYDLTFPLLKDSGNHVADLFAAQRTPEVVVLGPQREIRYRGRIDDQYDVGIQREAPTVHHLADALDAVLAGRDIEQPATTPVGCIIGRVREPDPDSSITWSNQIVRIVQQHCQNCHREGEVAPFALDTYEAAVGWAEMIGEVVAEGRMPPWHADPHVGSFANDPRLSDEERRQIADWVAAGAPEGDPADLPPPREFLDGWQIPEPDLVIHIADEPYVVPAEGPVEYQWFFVDPGFEQDMWVQAAEGRPDAREVVHHLTVYYKSPDVPWDLKHNDRIKLLGGFNPGGGTWVVPEGMAVRIPAGSHIAFEMHYTPNGVEHRDRSSFGLRFADPAQVKQEAICVMASNIDFTIPPYADDFLVESSYTLPADVLLLVMRPHMHLRGKSFRYDAIFPDGRRETLLNVPHYDFNWQHNYILSEPKPLPAGTEIHCSATFDNSAGNPANPDPSASVQWGDQTWDEMMIGMFAIARADQDLTKPLAASRIQGPSRAWLLVLISGAGLLGLLAWPWLRHRSASTTPRPASHATPSTSPP